MADRPAIVERPETRTFLKCPCCRCYVDLEKWCDFFGICVECEEVESQLQ